VLRVGSGENSAEKGTEAIKQSAQTPHLPLPRFPASFSATFSGFSLRQAASALRCNKPSAVARRCHAPARKGKLRLHRTRAPASAQLTALAGTIAHRVCRHLTRAGWLEGEGESAHVSDRATEKGTDAIKARA
jgi:hypothetical protein